MENRDILLLDDAKMIAPLDANVLLVASGEYVRDLSDGAFSDAFPNLRIVRLEATATVGHDLLAQAELLVLEVDPADRHSMQRLADIRASQPRLPVIAAIRESGLGLVRTLVKQGVADVVNLPFDLSELAQAALDGLASRPTASPPGPRLAPLIAVVGSTGGCGATSIATHLTHALASRDRSGKGVVIVDLDIQFGSVGHYLGDSGKSGSVADLLEAGARLDDELLRSTLARTSDNIALIAAPATMMPLEAVDTNQLLRILTLVRQQFAYVVLDLPTGWTNWSLSAASSADAVLLVTELAVNSLRQAKRSLNLFESVGLDSNRVHVVLNRVKRKLFPTIKTDDAETALGQSVLATVSLEDPLVSEAQDQGELASALQRRNHFTGDIGKLADLLCDNLVAKGAN